MTIKRIALCCFENSSKLYACNNPFPNAQAGDDAIVQSPSGLARVKIHGFEQWNGNASKSLIALVDDKTEKRERERLAKEQANKERRFAIIRELNVMWKEAEDLKRWKSIKSPAANALLRELKTLS